MKILTIESPQRLKDRTVKATITVSEEDYIPLIMLADRIYKGESGHLDIREMPKDEESWTPKARAIMMQWDNLLREIQEIGIKEGYAKAKDGVEGLLSPEKEELVKKEE